MAILVETATDNKNRTAADVRSIFSKSGGQLAGSGSVAWQFEPRGVVSVDLGGSAADDVALLAIDAGAMDVDTESDPLEVTTSPGDLELVRTALEAAGLRIESAEMTMQAKSPVEVDVDRARQNLRLIETLEDNDDVQRVTANFELPDESPRRGCRLVIVPGDRPRHGTHGLWTGVTRRQRVAHGRLRLPRDHRMTDHSRHGCCSSTRA